ncbi:Thyroid adenoma-associated protein homolog [Anthophora plagiata]
MELNHIIKELQTCTEDTVIFRKLINFVPSCKESWDDESIKKWQPVLIYILEIIIPNTEIGNGRVLLASHTFFSLLTLEPTLVLLKDMFTNFLTSKSNEIYAFDKKYDTNEPELFKLICTHGYLEANRKEMYSNRICLLIFDVIFEHCIRYTKYSYFAYKILYLWLKRTRNTNFWSTCSDLHLEQQLEEIIFSNWCNTINEIRKQNSVLIFNMYLKIMNKKYNGYLEYVFKHCVDTISWQNKLKYVILAEICEIWDNVEVITSRDFLLSLCTSLTNYHLCSAGTKVYLAIVKKLSENDWKKAFGDIMNYLFHHWESVESENHNALQLLWRYWLEPVIKKYRNILPYLWEFTRDIKTHFLRSHLQKIGCKMQVVLPQQLSVECYIYRNNEIVRLNGFAINCYRTIEIYNENKDRFFTIRNFLWYNANSTTVYMRDKIVKYFKVFYANVLKMCDRETDCIDDVYYITHWLHEFLLICIEQGSCYQRHILGIKLYEAVLSFTRGHAMNKSNNTENLLIEKYLQKTGKWEFTNERSLFILLELVSNSASDVKQIATSLILNYFDKKILCIETKKYSLFYNALEKCNKWKTYDAEGGAALMLIVANWLPSEENPKLLHILSEDFSKYSDYLLTVAVYQLHTMKASMNMAVITGKPFYGVMTALLNIAFQNGLESSYLTLEFIEKLLDVLENAVDLVLPRLSMKSNKEYSSFFTETELAIDIAIESFELEDNDLTPKKNIYVSVTILMCLKISCKIACEVGALMYTDRTVRRSINIIVTILLRCVHKGVAEAAATAIGRLTRCLCKESKYSDLPKIHISRILEHSSMVYLKTTKRVSVLSLMFHEIVVNDMRKDRPLLHFAIEKLLNFLENYDILESTKEKSLPDSPRTRYLHFLWTLVADKVTQAQLSPYMERISLICFKNLQSNIWTVRNTSLQLFNSIVSRLVGQNSYGQLDFGNGYSINHFLTHYPMVADYITKEFQRFLSVFKEYPTALYLHSNIVHILILLSQFSSTGCNLIDYSSQKYVSQVKYFLRMLFESPVLYVRLSAAKAYAALTDFLQIESVIEQLKREISFCRNRNLIHGCLLTMKFLKEKFSVEMESIKLCSDVNKQYKKREFEQCGNVSRLQDISRIWNNMYKEDSNPQLCYELETLLLQLQEPFIDEIYIFNENKSLLSSEKMKLGFSQFIDVSTKLYADYINRTNNINTDILQKILNSPCIDQTVSLINHVSSSTRIMRIVLEHFLSNEDNCNELVSTTINNYVLKTLKHCPLSDIKETVENLFKKIQALRNKHSQKLKWILLIFSRDMKVIYKTLHYYTFSFTTHPTEYMRRSAMTFMEISSRRFAELSKECRLIILYGCLILLKDEVSEIREAIVESLRMYVLRTINIEYGILEHGEHIYQKLLFEIIAGRSNFRGEKDMNRYFIQFFTSDLCSNLSQIIQYQSYQDCNLATGYFYREEWMFLSLCFYYKKQRHIHDECPTGDDTLEYNSENNLDVVNNIEKIHELNETLCNTSPHELLKFTHWFDRVRSKLDLVTKEYE